MKINWKWIDNHKCTRKQKSIFTTPAIKHFSGLVKRNTYLVKVGGLHTWLLANIYIFL